MATDYESPFLYELRQDTAGEPHLTFYANGRACTCPFQPVTPMEGTNGQMVAGRTPCNTSCPLAEFPPIPEEALMGEIGEKPKRGEIWAAFAITCGGIRLSRTIKVIPHSPIEMLKPSPLIVVN